MELIALCTEESRLLHWRVTRTLQGVSAGRCPDGQHKHNKQQRNSWAEQKHLAPVAIPPTTTLV